MDEENIFTECIICTKPIPVLEEFNGEMMCEVCYNIEENVVFKNE